MLSGVHRNTRQDQVVYGRPALEALVDTAKAFGARRLLVITTRSLGGPTGLATALAKGLGALCVGVFDGVIHRLEPG